MSTRRACSPGLLGAPVVLPLLLAMSLCLASLWTSSVLATPESEETNTAPTLNAIDEALAAGDISDSDAVLYKLYFLRGSNLLPKTYERGEDRFRCGTAIVQEAREKAPGFPADVQREIAGLLARPAPTEYVDTPHFRIHYATGGTDRILGWPNPAYLDSIRAACERSYRVCHEQQGWQVPPSDGTSGGNALIDCYVVDLNGVYGYTEGEEDGPAWPGDRTAFFVIDNDYDDFPNYADKTLPMKATVAHEYHHVVQMGYTASNPWWMEQMATFMEDEVFGSLHDNYQYLICYMQKPYKTLSYWDNCFPYATFLWPTLIKERHSYSVIRDIQSCAATKNIWTCFDDVLAEAGTDLSGALALWHVYNFYTGVRSDGQHYREGADYYPFMGYDRMLTSYPQHGIHPSPSRMPEPGSASVSRISRDISSHHNRLTLSFDGPDCTQQVVLIAKDASGPIFREYYMNLDASGNGTLDVDSWNTKEFAHLIVSMPRTCGSDAQDYVFGAVTTQSVDVDDEHPPLYTRVIELDQNEPNPFGPETFIGYRLREEMPVRLSIFDAAGREVRSLIGATQRAGAYTIRWDGRDETGRALAPGVYFYRLNAGAESEVRKMIVAG